MKRKNLKIVVSFLMLVYVALLASCQSSVQAENLIESNSDVETVFSENDENDIQTLIDSLYMVNMDRGRAIDALALLRHEGIDSIASIVPVDRAEMEESDKNFGVAFEYDISNADGKTVRVGVSSNGFFDYAKSYDDSGKKIITLNFPEVSLGI